VDECDLGVGDGIGGEDILGAYQFVFNELLVDFGVFVEVEGVEVFEAAEVDLIFFGVDNVEFHVEDAKF